MATGHVLCTVTSVCHDRRRVHVYALDSLAMGATFLSAPYLRDRSDALQLEPYTGDALDIGTRPSTMHVALSLLSSFRYRIP